MVFIMRGVSVALAVFLCLFILPCSTSRVFAAPSDANEDGDYYEILGLGQERDDASEREIKTAWRKLSKKHHPDLAGDAQREIYQRIQRAYEVLGDRRKRKVYDILGLEGLKKFEQPQNQQQQQMMNPLLAFFGGGNGMHGQQDRGKSEDLLLIVPLEDIYKGAAHTVKLGRVKICRSCRGTGAKSRDHLKECPHCGGHGRIVRRVQLAPGFVQHMEQPCGHCNGMGRVVAVRCPVCEGKQTIKSSAAISIDVEQGIPDGHVLTFELEADQQPNQVPGDVLVTVTAAPHDKFTRSGNDLTTVIKLSLKEALLGFDKIIKHLDGHDVELVETDITQHGTRKKIKGEGMPKHHVPSERGDLYVVYEVQLPSMLTAEQQEVMRRTLS